MLIFGIAALGLAIAHYLTTTQEGKDMSKLKDVAPEKQGGNYKRDYDIYFESVSKKVGVPFALLKAHAIMESSLNPAAFRDENPKKDPNKEGWASRGLMQILWSPLEPRTGDKGVNNQRWVKYGYSPKDLGVDGIRQFEPEVNITIAAKLIKENLVRTGYNLRDAVNMYNTGKKEADYKAPHNYTDKVITYYNTLLGD